MKAKTIASWGTVLFLVLLLISVSFRIVRKIRWYQFSQKFSLYGAAIKLDKPLIAGVDQIVRGEEAEKIIQKIANNPPVIDKDSEFMVFRIKVQNPTRKVVNPLAIEIQVFENTSSDYEGLEPIDLDLRENHDLLFKSDYKKLNIASSYEPGETKFGSHFFVIQKGSILKKYKVIWGGTYTEKRQSANLSPSKLQLFDPTDYFYLYFIALSLLATFYSLIQRKRKKSDGFAKSLTFGNIFFPAFLTKLFISAVLIITVGDVWSTNLYLKILLLLALLTFIYYLYVSHRYVIFFSFVSEKDVVYIQEEFIKRMGWTNVGIEKCRDHVEITNKDTWETYHFYRDSVKKEDVMSVAKAKKTLQEIYLSLPIDRAEVFNSVLYTLGFVVLMILFGI